MRTNVVEEPSGPIFRVRILSCSYKYREKRNGMYIVREKVACTCWRHLAASGARHLFTNILELLWSSSEMSSFFNSILWIQCIKQILFMEVAPTHKLIEFWIFFIVYMGENMNDKKIKCLFVQMSCSIVGTVITRFPVLKTFFMSSA
jgi:hypothetical protein